MQLIVETADLRQALASVVPHVHPDRSYGAAASAAPAGRCAQRHGVGDVVLLVAHPCEADPYSGAGNCWCGRHDTHSLHRVVVDPSGEQETS